MTPAFWDVAKFVAIGLGARLLFKLWLKFRNPG